ALRPGMRIPEGADIVTAEGALVQLQADGIPPIVIGGEREVALGADMMQPRVDPMLNAVADNLSSEQLQVLAALQEGVDPFDELEAPVAVLQGGVPGEGGGFVRIAPVIETVEPLALQYPRPGFDFPDRLPLAGVSTPETTGTIDTPDTPQAAPAPLQVTVTLSVNHTWVAEGGTNLIYTVTLLDAAGNPYVAVNDIFVTTELGVITVPAGGNTGTLELPVQGDDPYIDPETVTNVITDIEEDGGGSGIELGYDDTPVDTVIEDTVDTVTAYLTAAATVNEGQRQLVYTVTLRDADGNAVVTNNDVTVTTAKGVVVIPAGSSSGSFTVPVQGDDPYIDPETITNAITAI